jgi:hypothetical protein
MTIYLERGYSGEWTRAWQAFLAGEGIYVGDYTDNFGPITEDATERAQAAWGLKPDGEVGDKTTKAARKRGFVAPWADKPPGFSGEPAPLTIGEQGFGDPDFPQPSDLDGDGKADLVYLKKSERQKLWGLPRYVVVDGKPKALAGWEKNLVRVHVPQLKGVDCYGRPHSGNVKFHKKAVPQLLGAMQEVEEAGLLEDITSYGGTYVFRFIRGSTKTLSNHAFGVAIDFNMKENGLGKRPALLGEVGTLRRIAKIFEKWGFFWGGWYRNRKDGMHFECVELFTPSRLKKQINGLKNNEHIVEWMEKAA